MIINRAYNAKHNGLISWTLHIQFNSITLSYLYETGLKKDLLLHSITQLDVSISDYDALKFKTNLQQPLHPNEQSVGLIIKYLYNFLN